MQQQLLLLLIVVVCCLSAVAFRPAARGAACRQQQTQLYEDFDLTKTTIISAKEIFSEKQLREFTSTYSEDVRPNPFSFITDLLFKPKEGQQAAKTTASAPSSIKSALKPTVSVEVVESKTSQFISGAIDAKKFAVTLNAAFGPKLPQVLPEILASLPPAKATALASVTK